MTGSTKSDHEVKVDVMAAVDDLATVPLFSSLDEERLANVAEWFHVQNANEGVKLVGGGVPGYTFFVLIEGTKPGRNDRASLSAIFLYRKRMTRSR